MKKSVALLMKEKWLRMNGKMMTDFVQVFYSKCKKLGQFFFHTYLLTCKERYISFVKSCKYLNKLTSIKTIVLIF